VSLRIRFILIVLSLFVVFAILFFTAHATLQAIQNIHDHQYQLKQNDVQLIQPWMTLPYIAHIYHIPVNILYASLRLPDNRITGHSTLQILARKRKESIHQLITCIQQSIILYRNTHPIQPYPSPTIGRGEIFYY